jgi:VanZ family protein
MTLAGYLSALGEPRAGRKSAATAVGLVFVLEASQVLIGSRMPSLWDAVVASTGVLIGAGMWTVAERVIWPRLWLTVLVLSTSGAAALLMLSPFEIAPGYRDFGWFPFLGYYARTTFETLSHVIELALLYFPLGFGLSWLKGNSRQAFVTGVVVVLAIAIPVEYAQGWIVGRYPDITDATIGLIGVWAGIHAYNRRRA